MILGINNLEAFSRWKEIIYQDGGLCLIDKDIDWTSFDICAKIRGITHVKKVGHAGTLDPFATGLLIVAVGKATKEISKFQDLDKTYTGKIKLGAVTKTYDNESEEENVQDISELTAEQIILASTIFNGRILQTPPIYSAKKVKGKALYEYARKNQQVEIMPVEVTVKKFEIVKIELPFIEFEIECSKGTYIRSIANDLGAKLGCGGYLTSLRRTIIGNYSVENALKIKEFESHFVKAQTS